MKVTGKVWAVRVIKSATVYVQAKSHIEALRTADTHLGEIRSRLKENLEEQFQKSSIELLDAEVYPLKPQSSMKEIWVEDRALTYEDYEFKKQGWGIL